MQSQVNFNRTYRFRYLNTNEGILDSNLLLTTLISGNQLCRIQAVTSSLSTPTERNTIHIKQHAYLRGKLEFTITFRFVGDIIWDPKSILRICILNLYT